MVENVNIAQVTSILKAVKKDSATKSKICLFVGAGVDISSGGKTFRKLKFDFVNKFVEPITDSITDEELTERFDKALETKDNAERVQLLNSVSANEMSFTDGYKALILLASKGYIDAIITTNFFDFLEHCQREMQLYPFHILSPGYTNADQFYNRVASHDPIYLKLHGNAWTHDITHVTTNEINHKEYSSSTRNLIQHILQTYSLVFIGYGGYDNKLTETIKPLIEQELDVFWVTPDEIKDDSPLVKFITEKGRLKHCQDNFDNFILRYATECLAEDFLSDVHPTFILSLLEDRIRQHKEQLIGDTSKIIERNLHGEIVSRIFDNGDDILLFGKKGLGKTSIIRYFSENNTRDLIVPIDMKLTEEKSILHQIATVLGYKTKIPFSLLYSFCQWCSHNSHTVIFVIDAISSSAKESVIRYREEFFNFILSMKHFPNVRFLVSVDNSFDMQTIDEHIFASNCRYEVSTFSEHELEDLLEIHNIASNEIKKSHKSLLQTPYLCGLYCENQANLVYHQQLLSTNFLQELDMLLCGSQTMPHGLTATTLQNAIFKIIEKNLAGEHSSTTYVDDKSVNYLRSLNILELKEEDIQFQFQIVEVFYAAKFIYTKSNHKYMKKLYDHLRGGEACCKLLYEAYICHFALARTNKEMSDDLNFLNETLGMKSDPKITIKFAKEALCSILDMNANLFAETISQCGLVKYNLLFQKCIFATIARINDTLLKYKILEKFSSIDYFSLDMFIIKGDIFHNAIKKSISKTEFIRESKLFICSSSSLIWQYFSCLYQLTLLDTKATESSFIAKQFIGKISELKNKMISEGRKKDIVNDSVIPIFKKYSYNILFNASEHIEESFSALSQDTDLIGIYNHVLSKKMISTTEYDRLFEKMSDINNMWKFLFANLLVVFSMKNHCDETVRLLERKVETFEKDILVQQLDFYLSSIFMAFFELPDHGREQLIKIFEVLTNKFQVKMFEQPKIERIASSEKFSDDFDLIFEDGFNPLAFYFYTASAKRNTNILPLYNKLTKLLVATGNEGKILKIVHAIGQMVSITPKEGFVALGEIIQMTKHRIVKKGVLRILKEHSIRYPQETAMFIKDNKDYFTTEDKNEIFLSIDTKLENRTFEQLHWSRLFHYIELGDSGFLEKFISAMATAENLSAFISEIFFQSIF